ncbi:MAG: hypothetical protein JSS34_01290 [Proteobacteria bacterium]|nr:hypothetical protein [Pseudomonadota bacterium]
MKDSETLKSVMKICDIHAFRLERALIHIHQFVPITPKKISSFSDQDLSFLELLTSRFSKLLDLIGSKVFPFVLRILKEDEENFSLLDRLYKLEKLDFLPSAQMWMEMREIRNHVTYEYPDDPDLAAQNLNKVIEASQDLLSYWKALKNKIHNSSFFK